MTWTNTDWLTLLGVIGFVIGISTIFWFIFWIIDKLNPVPPYKGLYNDGRVPKELTTEELHKALSKNGHALREWHAVITELVVRNHK